MNNNIVETLIGAVVLFVAGGFLWYAYTRTDVAKVEGYEVIARFDKVDGLNVGADVKVSGIKVGTVAEQSLDPLTFLAVVKINLKNEFQLPKDSSAKITSDGLLGGKFISLVPGGAEENLAAGDSIEFTQGSIDLIELVGKAMYSPTSSSSSGSGSSATSDVLPLPAADEVPVPPSEAVPSASVPAPVEAAPAEAAPAVETAPVETAPTP